MMQNVVDKWGWGRAAVLLLIFVCGCQGGDSRPSSRLLGKVTLEGEPLEGASIHFTSTRSGETAHGNLKPGGEYVVSLPATDLGEEYVVVFALPVTEEVEVHANEAETPVGKLLVPAKYQDRVTTDLKVKVEKAGDNEFNFDLKKS